MQANTQTDDKQLARDCIELGVSRIDVLQQCGCRGRCSCVPIDVLERLDTCTNRTLQDSPQSTKTEIKV